MRAKHGLYLKNQNLGRRFGTSKMHLSGPFQWLRLMSVEIIDAENSEILSLNVSC